MKWKSSVQADDASNAGSASEAGRTRSRPAPLWTKAQRIALLAILVLLIGYAATRYALNPAFVSNPQPDSPARAHELADRIDPNTASVETLAALPTLGEKRARAIVEYRQRYATLTTRSSAPIFAEPNDLMKVRGIGVATLNQIKPFLIFPNPTTRQAREGTADDRR